MIKTLCEIVACSQQEDHSNRRVFMMQIAPTPYADINELLSLLLSQLRMILGEKLVGLYLFGSLAGGYFEYKSSDIDLIAALATDLNEEEFERLKVMHRDIAKQERNWEDRIETGYITVENLKKSQSPNTMAVISPGKPFLMQEASADWIINRSVLYEMGIALYGPSAKAIATPIAREELMRAIQEIVREWRELIMHTDLIRRREEQAYAILTMCRILYRVRHDGKGASKKESAQWAEEEMPEWSSLIQNALVWRENWRDKQVDHDGTLEKTLRFIHLVLGQCESDFDFFQIENELTNEDRNL
jgi:predicted nucleotidyltransferase